MKALLLLFIFILGHKAFAQSACDVRIGTSVGVKVVEFVSGNTIHSKMSLKDTTAETMFEEMLSLQDEGVCEEKIISKRCVLKFEKKAKTNFITMYRGQDKWVSWFLKSKIKAQDFVKNMKRAGFCS